MEEHERIELRSQEVQEILGTPPRWIIRWGTTIAFLTFCVLLLASYVIRYPDIIVGQVELVSDNPPVDVTSRITSNIATLYVADNQKVEKGQLLLVLDDLASYDDVLTLEEQLEEQLTNIDEKALMNFFPIEDLQLGELEELYTQIIEIRSSYVFGATSGYVEQDIEKIKDEIKSVREAIQENNNRRNPLLIELRTTRMALKEQKNRFKDRPGELDKLQTTSMSLKRLMSDSTKLLADNAFLELEIKKLQKSINSIKTATGENKSSRLVTLQTKVSLLQNQIKSWKEKHEILAPVNGQVVFAEKLSENQIVQQDQKLMTIVQQEDASFYGSVKLPIKGSGKVDTGQVVVIKFDNYPYQEYGMVKGTVSQKAILPQNQVYNIRVELAKPLITTHGRELPYTRGMQGTAEIVTKDRRFIERLFENMTAFAEDY